MTKTKYDGLYYRMDRNNKKVYIARIYINGKDTSKTLGKEPQLNLKTANRLRLELLAEYKDGKINNNKTMEYFFNAYIELRSPTLSKDWSYKSKLTWNKYLKNDLAHKIPKIITTHDIQKVVNEMINDGKAANTVKQIKDLISGLFKHLPMLGLQGIYNVASDVVIPKFDNSRNIELTDIEIKKLFDAIFNYPDIKIRTIFIWLLHGRRKGEVLNIRWESIDFANNIYTIDFDNTKGTKILQYELTEVLIKALNEYGIKETGLVFPSNINKEKTFSKTGMDYHWKNIRFETGIKYLRMHDLRHIIGGFAVNKGYSLEITGKVLGHKTANITQRYAKVQRKVIRNVLDDLFSTYKS